MGIEYTFTTESGWRVHEYRPFSLSYAVRQTPGLSPYSCLPYRRDETLDAQPAAGDATESVSVRTPDDLLSTLINDKLRFDYLSWDVVRRLVEERVRIRDKHRKDILGQITDVSGEIYCCHLAKTPDSQRRKSAMEKAKLDLEKQARDEDVALWKDVTDLRKELLTTQRQYESARMRQHLVTDISPHDGDKEETHPMGTGYLSGT